MDSHTRAGILQHVTPSPYNLRVWFLCRCKAGYMPGVPWLSHHQCNAAASSASADNLYVGNSIVSSQPVLHIRARTSSSTILASQDLFHFGHFLSTFEYRNRQHLHRPLFQWLESHSMRFFGTLFVALVYSAGQGKLQYLSHLKYRPIFSCLRIYIKALEIPTVKTWRIPYSLLCIHIRFSRSAFVKTAV